MTGQHTRVAVVGGGIAGLSLGFHLMRHGVAVRVVEGAARPGGNIRTEERDGYRCEWGPNGFLDSSPPTIRLVDALGLQDELAPSSDATRVRWIVRDGRLRRLPAKPQQLLASDVLSLKGRLRVLAEPLQAARRDDADESVFDFARRRIGAEAAEVLVDAMVTGIYAGDPRRLSLEAAFPRLRALEREHGGLLRGMLALRKEKRGGRAAAHGSALGPAGVLTSFDTGMETLVQALAGVLGENLTCDTRLTRLERTASGWRLEFEQGAPLTAEQVVLACPAWVAAPLLHGLDADLAERVSAIPSAPVAVVCTGWAERDVARVERGFGFLVPGREQSPVLGTLFDSWAFPNRAPQGRVLWRTLLGGARAAAVLDLEDPALVNHTLRALEKWLGLRATPEMVRVVRHPRGIPQYPVGHAREVARIDARLERQPGLHLTGNCYRGIAMNACIQEAEALAARVAGAPLPQAASRA